MFRRYLYITTYGTNRNIGTYVRTLTIQNIGTYDIENVEFKIEKDFFQQVLREIFDASMTQYAIWHVFGTYSGTPPTHDLTPSSPCSKNWPQVDVVIIGTLRLDEKQDSGYFC